MSLHWIALSWSSRLGPSNFGGLKHSFKAVNVFMSGTVDIGNGAVHEDGPVFAESFTLFGLSQYVSPHALLRKWCLRRAVFDFDEPLVNLVLDVEEAVVDMLCGARAGGASVGLEEDGAFVVLLDDIALDIVALGFNEIEGPYYLGEHIKHPDEFVFSGAAALDLLFVGLACDCALSKRHHAAGMALAVPVLGIGGIDPPFYGGHIGCREGKFETAGSFEVP